MEGKVTDTNMYFNESTTSAVENIFSYRMEEDMYNEEDISMYNYEDEDAFSDIDYDSDDCEASLRMRRYDDDSEDEIWEEEEEEEEDEEISHSIRLQLLREKNKKQLEGLSVLDNKLNWLEKVPDFESDIDNAEYPILGAIIKPDNNKYKVKQRSPKLYIPATHIKVKVGEKTFIEFEPIICKNIQEGKICAYGESCKFSHNLPKPKVDYKNKLCNFIKNGDICKFASRCKFSHDISLFNKERSEKKIEKKIKPLCRNGIKCENRKCTFTHPSGHKKAQVEQTPRSPHSSPKRTPHSSPKQALLEQVDRKFLLCKNMFKIENGAIVPTGKCRYGTECKFAHSRNEVEKKINDNLSEFECTHSNCKGVEIEFFTKKDKSGKDRKTRRYKNSGVRKCFKLHQKERVTDFIIRTQGSHI